MQETRVRALGWEDPLEKEMAIHSSTTAWKSHGQRGLEAYSAQGRRVRHELATKQQHRVHTLFSEHLSEKMVSDASS